MCLFLLIMCLFSNNFVGNISKYAVLDSGLNFSIHCVICVNIKFDNLIQQDVNIKSSQFSSLPPGFVWDMNDFSSHAVATNVALLSL